MNVVSEIRRKTEDYFSKLRKSGIRNTEIPYTHSFGNSSTQVLLGGGFSKKILALKSEQEIFDTVLNLSDENVGLSFQTPTHSVYLVSSEEYENSTGFLKKYRHILFYSNFDSVTRRVNENQWSVLRFECDTNPGYNSWMLNHPVHHYHTTRSEEIRLVNGDFRTMIGFVDWALRTFRRDAWAEMYPKLHRELSNPAGPFAFLTQTREKGGKPFNEASR